MLRGLRENGPVVLVPAAWGFVLAAHLDLVGLHPLFVAHVVMATVIALFAVLSWSDMTEGILLGWKLVFLLGFPITAAGVVALLSRPPTTALLAASLYGWMLLPVPALVYTARNVGPSEYPRVYAAGAGLSLLGVAVYAGGSLVDAGVVAVVAGLLLVGVGQTAAIVTAVVRY